jgi:hypothetical protein
LQFPYFVVELFIEKGNFTIQVGNFLFIKYTAVFLGIIGKPLGAAIGFYVSEFKILYTHKSVSIIGVSSCLSYGQNSCPFCCG